MTYETGILAVDAQIYPVILALSFINCAVMYPQTTISNQAVYSVFSASTWVVNGHFPA